MDYSRTIETLEAGNRIYKIKTVTNKDGEVVWQAETQALRNGKPYGPIGNYISTLKNKRITITEDLGERTYKTPMEKDANDQWIMEPFIRKAHGYASREDLAAAIAKHAEKPYVAKGKHADKLRAAGKLDELTAPPAPAPAVEPVNSFMDSVRASGGTITF